MKIKDIMTRELFFVRPNRNLDIVDDVMEWHDIRHVLVIDSHGYLLGVISQRDILRSAVSNQTNITQEDQKHLFSLIPVTEIMKTRLITTTPETPIHEAAQLLLENKIGCLPVLDVESKVIGIVSESDFVKWAAINDQK